MPDQRAAPDVIADTANGVRYRCTNSECRSGGAWLPAGEIVTYQGINDTWGEALYHAFETQGTLLDPIYGRTNVTRLPTGLEPEDYPLPCGPVVAIHGPARIRLSRRKGSRRPEGVIAVARPSRWGNPFSIASCIETGFADNEVAARRVCVDAFRSWLREGPQSPWWFDAGKERFVTMTAGVRQLRGSDLACWCPLDEPCHADVLLEVANG